MRTRTIAAFVSGLLLAATAWLVAATGHPSSNNHQAVMPAPHGPFHVSAARLLDSRGRAFLLRGTELPVFHPADVAWNNRAEPDYGPHSGTSLSAIRLRFNMNAVRLPLDVSDTPDDPYLAALDQVVSRANQMELLVVLAAREPGAALPSQRTIDFWIRCAAYFKDRPNVIFEAGDPSSAGDPRGAGDLVAGGPHSPAGWRSWRDAMQRSIAAIRSAGAHQPIVAMSWQDDRLFEGLDRLLDDPNVIYGASPDWTTTRTDADRDARFGFLASRVPVIANGWDLRLNDAAACQSLPQDPSAASAMVNGAMNYFDARHISWTVSTFEPGKLIKDLADHDATTLENGWTCGPSVHPYAGMGRLIEAHLRSSEERGLFVVSGAGGLDLARGGFALAYGPVMAGSDAVADGLPPRKLGGISVEITDSAGVSRPAAMLWASAGWGQTNFVIPRDSALGPARMTIVRDDGSRTAANISIVETAPGFITGYSCRGAVRGIATQTFADGRRVSTPISECPENRCRTLVVPMSPDAATTVRLQASGVRNAASASQIEVTVAGVRVPVIAYGPAGDDGQDHVTIQIPQSLHGIGETDLVARLNGRISNVVRLRIGEYGRRFRLPTRVTD